MTHGDHDDARLRGPASGANPFSDLFDHFWNCTVGEDDTHCRVVLIEKMLTLTRTDHVLVYPSGGCRLALALVARGYAVTGLDDCPIAVERCATLAERHGSSARFREATSVHFPATPLGTAAVCLGWPGSVAELAAWLASALSDHGRALIELEPTATAECLDEALRAVGFALRSEVDLWEDGRNQLRRVIVVARC